MDPYVIQFDRKKTLAFKLKARNLKSPKASISSSVERKIIPIHKIERLRNKVRGALTPLSGSFSRS